MTVAPRLLEISSVTPVVTDAHCMPFHIVSSPCGARAFGGFVQRRETPRKMKLKSKQRMTKVNIIGRVRPEPLKCSIPARDILWEDGDGAFKGKFGIRIADSIVNIECEPLNDFLTTLPCSLSALLTWLVRILIW
jgi:hypothetical protein